MNSPNGMHLAKLRKSVGGLLVCAAASVGVAACDDPIVTSHNDTLEVERQLIRGSDGSVTDKSIMDQRLRTVARAVALALADPEVRDGVHAAIHASPFPEGKLHFRTLFEDSQFTLRQTMAVQSGLSEAELGALLDGLVDLEFYMPVDEHRMSTPAKKWTEATV